MILPERVLGRSATKKSLSGRASAPIFLPTWARSSAFRSSPAAPAFALLLENAERRDRRALELVRHADHGGLSHRRMVHEGRLDLHRPDAVPRHVHDVVHAAEQPEVAVLVALGAVPREVDVLPPARPVGLHVALVVAPDRAEHGRPGPGDRQVSPADLHLAAFGVEDLRLDPGKGARGRPGPRGRHAGQRRDQNHPGLRLPPGVDDRALSVTDVLAVPHPRLGIDRLADAPEQAQGREVVLLGPLRPPLHERPDRRRSGVEDRDAVPLDQVPEAVARRRVRSALVHQTRRAVGERAVDHVRVARHPTDVGRAPVDVLVLQIEDPLRRRVHADQIPAGGVENALGLPRRAGRIEDVEGILGVHLLGRAALRRVFHQVVPPLVAAVPRLDLRARALHDHHVPDRRRLLEGLVGNLLQRNDVSAPPAPIRRHEDRRLLVVDPIAQGLRREAAEHHRMNRADARARQHRHRKLRDHRADRA